MTTRIGIPIDHLAHGYTEEVCSPIFSTAIGLLLKGIDETENGSISISQPDLSDLSSHTPQPVAVDTDDTPKRNWYDKIFEKTKEFFTVPPFFCSL